MRMLRCFKEAAKKAEELEKDLQQIEDLKKKLSNVNTNIGINEAMLDDFERPKIDWHDEMAALYIKIGANLMNQNDSESKIKAIINAKNRLLDWRDKISKQIKNETHLANDKELGNIPIGRNLLNDEMAKEVFNYVFKEKKHNINDGCVSYVPSNSKETDEKELNSTDAIVSLEIDPLLYYLLSFYFCWFFLMFALLSLSIIHAFFTTIFATLLLIYIHL